MGILCVFCVYDTIGNRCFEKTSFPKMAPFSNLSLLLGLNPSVSWNELVLSIMFSKINQY